MELVFGDADGSAGAFMVKSELFLKVQFKFFFLLHRKKTGHGKQLYHLLLKYSFKKAPRHMLKYFDENGQRYIFNSQGFYKSVS